MLLFLLKFSLHIIKNKAIFLIDNSDLKENIPLREAFIRFQFIYFLKGSVPFLINDTIFLKRFTLSNIVKM